MRALRPWLSPLGPAPVWALLTAMLLASEVAAEQPSTPAPQTPPQAEESTQPEAPTQPKTPAQPEDSEQPDTPAQPDAPKPSTPQQPKEPEQPSQNTENAESSVPAQPKLVPPKVRKDTTPTYPVAAQEQAISGEVVLEIEIDTTGRVTEAAVVSAQPEGQGFEPAALEAARQLLFAPATEGGEPVPVRIQYRFRFVPNVAPPEKTATTEAEQPSKTEAPTPDMGELTGQIRERGTRLPVAGAKVTIFRSEGDDAVGFETETDEQGNFRFKGLLVGKWRLLADPDGYYPVRESEQVAKDARTEVRYSIEKSSYNPYDVIVDAERVKREVSRTSIQAERAERIPGTFGDVLAVVQNLPGVARAPAFSGEVIVRGSAPEDSQTFINGMNVPLVYHFGGLRSVMPVGMIEQIDFYPGNFSVEYGRATGGVIDVDLKHLKPKKIGGYADVSLLDTSLYLEAPVTDKLSIAIAGRRSYIGDVLGLALSDSAASIVAPRYYDTQALVSYRPSPAHQFEAFFLYSDDLFELVLDEPQAASAQDVISDVGLMTKFYRVMGEYRYVPNERFDNELKFSVGRDLFNFNVGRDVFIDSELLQLQVRDAARYEFSDLFALRTGVDFLYAENGGDARLPDFPEEGDPEDEVSLSDVTDVDLGSTAISTAAYAELEFTPWEGTLILPGVRAEHFSTTEEFTLSPRLSARQRVHPQWTLKGGVGLFMQEPQPTETNEQLGNPDLGVEQAMHYSAGVEFKPADHLSFDLTGFYKTLHDQVSATDAVVENADGESRALNYDNNGEGRVVGLELLAKHELHDGFSGWVAYTLSQAERKDSGSTEYRLFDFDQTHILTAVGSYQLPRNWEVSSRFRYVTGNVYTPATGGAYDADADEYLGIYGAVNSERAKQFYQLDVRIDKRWVFDSWMLNAYLDIQNVTNRANIDSFAYNYDFSETEDTQQGLPLIPVIGLRGEF